MTRTRRPLSRTGRRWRRAVRGRPRARVRRFPRPGVGPAARRRPVRLPGPDARLQGLGGRAARPDREVGRDLPARVAGAGAHHGERRQGRVGPDRALRGRHLGDGAAPADRAAGRRQGHRGHRRHQRRHHRRAAEVPVVVPLPRAGRRRYGAVGSLRADHGQAGRGPARRQGAAAARLRIEHAPRHQPGRRGDAAREAARHVRLQGVQDPARHARRPQPGRRARAQRSDHPGGAQGGRAGHRAARRREQLLHARRRDRDGTPSRGRPLRRVRGAVPVLGARVDARGHAGADRSTSRAASRTTTWPSGAA